ncbi:hypothetical protein G9444_1322 [Rhodococcus erythropolis]|uniref:Uncharacterized protein n=1 Tax=Rhodococcus erythropolis TaxID=1833 RepID=A0A6G9CPD2_RHOER|nr:hypothetical protein G9444_1322 [Rhodococcus erythropolis]
MIGGPQDLDQFRTLRSGPGSCADVDIDLVDRPGREINHDGRLCAST